MASNGELVLEAWFYDMDYICDEELVRLVIPANQTDRLLDALNAALRTARGSNQEDLADPIEALKALPIFDFRAGVFGVERLRWWLDGTRVEYEWKQDDLRERHRQNYRKGPSPLTQLPAKLGERGEPLGRADDSRR